MQTSRTGWHTSTTPARDTSTCRRTSRRRPWSLVMSTRSDSRMPAAGRRFSVVQLVSSYLPSASWASRPFPTSSMLGLVVASTGLQLPTASQPPSTRRALLSSTAGLAALALPGASFAAVKPCKGGAQNCFSTAGPDKAKVSQWAWPSGMSRADATASLKSVLEAYPQAGQDGVDGGGWTLTKDTLVDSGVAAFEFKSAGTGNMAKFFNGGKPFIDDLEVSVEDTYVRSSARSPLA